MYRSLTLLAADDENAARNPDRLAKLGKHRTLVLRTKVVSYAAIVLMGAAWLLVMRATATDVPILVYIIVSLVLLGFFLGARRSLGLARHDPIAQAAQAPQRFAFAPARITGATERTEGSGRYSYQVIDAVVQFEAGAHKEAIQLVATFERSIWSFEKDQLPIAGRVVYQVDDPTRAALISVSQSAINQIDPKRKRDAKGYGSGMVMAWGFLVFAAVVFLLSIAMIVTKLVTK